MGAEPTRVFLLSPADCGGDRARLVLSPRASFALAVRLRDGGAPLGEVMSFMSGLYFRGKLAYARAFARPPDAVLVITPNAGLVPADTIVGVAHLRKFARGDVDPDRRGYRRPLLAASRMVVEALPPDGQAVLLGSIATDKYVRPLTSVFGERLVFPPAFVGIGDMSRGALLLRAARARVELDYVPVAGAVRHRART